MAGRDIPQYERRIFSVQDPTNEKQSSYNKKNRQEIESETGGMQQINKLMGIAIVILLFIVAALTVALIMSLTASCGTPPSTTGSAAPRGTTPLTTEAAPSSRLPDDLNDCQDLYNFGVRVNGIYTINPTNWPGSPFEVYCNMSDGGGWTVFQRRLDGSVDFYLDWASYKTGFGDMTNEFWLGNEKLYYLTNQGSCQMRIDLVNTNGVPYYAKYSTFSISSESDNYRLMLGKFNGSANHDALEYHQDQPFSTKDRDNDVYGGSNCAVLNHGAWWYKKCLVTHLNGNYDSITWRNLPGNHRIRYTEMKIRPA